MTCKSARKEKSHKIISTSLHNKLIVADPPTGFAILKEVIKHKTSKEKVSTSSFEIKEWDAPVSKRTRIGRSRNKIMPARIE